MLRSILRGPDERWLATLSLVVAVASSGLEAQPTWVGLQHGFVSNQYAWGTTGLTLSQRYLVNWDATTTSYNSPISTQEAAVRAYYAGRTAQTMLVGHSLGGLVSRAAAQSNVPWYGLVTMGTPNAGAPLASNVLNGVAFNLIANRLNTLTDAVALYAGIITNSDLRWVLIGDIAFDTAESWVITGNNLLPLLGIRDTILRQLTPGNLALQTINSNGSLNTESLNAHVRYEITSSLNTNSGVVFRAAGSSASVAADDRDLLDFFEGFFIGSYVWYSSNIDYSDPNWAFKQAYAFVWLNVASDLATIDVDWCSVIGARSGNACAASDGVVPLALQHLPGTVSGTPLPMTDVDHLN